MTIRHHGSLHGPIRDFLLDLARYEVGRGAGPIYTRPEHVPSDYAECTRPVRLAANGMRFLFRDYLSEEDARRPLETVDAWVAALADAKRAQGRALNAAAQLHREAAGADALMRNRTLRSLVDVKEYQRIYEGVLDDVRLVGDALLAEMKALSAADEYRKTIDFCLINIIDGGSTR